MKFFYIFSLISILFVMNCKKDNKVFSPENSGTTLGEIVYVSDVEGDLNIYTMDINGNNKKQLTQNPEIDYRPTYSSDGNKIAYFSVVNGQGGIWIMNGEKSVNKKLFDVPEMWSRYPKFTLSGEMLLHLSTDGQILNTINVDGTNKTTINVAMYTNYALRPWDYSPNESKIVFSSDQFIPGNYDICTLDLNNGQIEKLNLTIDTRYDLGPRFSPDGQSIVYFTEMDSNNIYSFDLDSNKQVKLTPDSIYSQFDPIFTPNGSKIIFTAEHLPNSLKKNSKPLGKPSLFIMNSDGSNIIQLSEEFAGSYSADVVFSDNGDHLYYLGLGDIFEVNLNTLVQEKVVDLSFDIYSLTQKGSYLYFISHSVIYRANKDGTDLLNLTDSTHSCFDFQMAP